MEGALHLPEGTWMDEAAGEFVLDFLRLLTHTKGQWAGQPFRTLPWQEDCIRQFYGAMTEDEYGRAVRLRQYLYIEIPKKNGKSELAAGLGLYHLIADGEANGEVYVCAADRDNAGIIYEAACQMIANSPYLSERLKLVKSQKRIIDPVTGSIMRVLSAEAYSKHGYSPSCVIFDELHAQPGRELWDVMTTGAGAARRQSVWIVLTTAGNDPDRTSIGWEVHEKCRRILALRRETPESENDVDNPLWLPVIYGLPDDPEQVKEIDIYDPDVWKRCNPSIGTTISLRTVRNEAIEAKESEAKERNFRWLRLNQWVATKHVGWIPLTLYDKTQWHIPELERTLKGNALRRAMRESLRGKKCFGGLDLSSTTDLTAFVLLFPPQPGLEKWVMVPQAWMPDSDIISRERRDHVPYRGWSEAEFLHLCEGDMIDFPAVEAAVLEAKANYKLKLLGVDPYLSRTITARLTEAGVPVAEIPQTMLSLSPPMKEIERLIRSRELLHLHNTCARWCFGNVRCAVDGNENMKPMKNKSTGRIDIAVAWIIAMAAAMVKQAPDLNDALEAGTWSM